MKKLILISSIIFLSLNSLFADQLAYISKQDADKAAELIRGKKIILYCGCCDNDMPQKVEVLNVEVRFTGYENYYEVYITYKNKEGEILTEPIDLAYTWIKLKRSTQTVGEALNLEHDPCSEALKWK